MGKNFEFIITVILSASTVQISKLNLIYLHLQSTEIFITIYSIEKYITENGRFYFAY